MDYAAAAEAVKALASAGSRVLVETLAEDIARMLITRFPIAAVEVELRKFILPDTEFVGVRIRRDRTRQASRLPVRRVGSRSAASAHRAVTGRIS